MENSEWPDAEKLKELRLTGIFPYSLLTINCITTVTVLAAICMQLSRLIEVFNLIKGILVEPVTNFASVKVQSLELLNKLASIFLTFGAAFIISFLLIVFIQSKFYFSLINLSFNLSHILKVKNISFKFFLSTISRGLFGLSLGFAIGSALFYWVSRQFLAIIFSKEFYGGKAIDMALLLPVIKSLIIISIFLLLILSVLSYLIVRFSFMLKHRSADRFGSGR